MHVVTYSHDICVDELRRNLKIIRIGGCQFKILNSVYFLFQLRLSNTSLCLTSEKDTKTKGSLLILKSCVRMKNQVRKNVLLLSFDMSNTASGKLNFSGKWNCTVFPYPRSVSSKRAWLI